MSKPKIKITEYELKIVPHKTVKVDYEVKLAPLKKEDIITIVPITKVETVKFGKFKQIKIGKIRSTITGELIKLDKKR